MDAKQKQGACSVSSAAAVALFTCTVDHHISSDSACHGASGMAAGRPSGHAHGSQADSVTHAAQGLSYNAEWMRDNWCHRDADPEVCRITQQVAAFDYARIAAEKADAGVPGGVSLWSSHYH